MPSSTIFWQLTYTTNRSYSMQNLWPDNDLLKLDSFTAWPAPGDLANAH